MAKEKDRKAETLNHLSIHQSVRSAIFASQQLTSPIGFSFLKLPPPPCAVLLVFPTEWKNKMHVGNIQKTMERSTIFNG